MTVTGNMQVVMNDVQLDVKSESTFVYIRLYHDAEYLFVNLTPHQARLLAQQLMSAADKVDAQRDALKNFTL